MLPRDSVSLSTVMPYISLIHTYTRIHIFTATHLLTHSLFLSISLSIYPSIYPSIHPSIYLSIYMSMAQRFFLIHQRHIPNKLFIHLLMCPVLSIHASIWRKGQTQSSPPPWVRVREEGQYMRPCTPPHLSIGITC